jgi:hypothetical protein
MKMPLFAGALALAAMVLFLQFSLTARAADLGTQVNGDRLASINISRVKSVLKLTPEQERYWQPVEAALRSLARHQARQDANGGFIHRVSQRVVSIVLSSAAIERLAVAARPLIAALTEDQKRSARDMAQEMGLGPVVAALN